MIVTVVGGVAFRILDKVSGRSCKLIRVADDLNGTNSANVDDHASAFLQTPCFAKTMSSRSTRSLHIVGGALSLRARCSRSSTRCCRATIIWSERQLKALLDEYFDHYNSHRPHRRINQRAPDDTADVVPIRPGHPIERHSTCTGLINEYRTAA